MSTRNETPGSIHSRKIAEAAHLQLPLELRDKHYTDAFVEVLNTTKFKSMLPKPTGRRNYTNKYVRLSENLELKGAKEAIAPYFKSATTFSPDELARRMHHRLLADALVLSGEHPWCTLPVTRANSPTRGAQEAGLAGVQQRLNLLSVAEGEGESEVGKSEVGETHPVPSHPIPSHPIPPTPSTPTPPTPPRTTPTLPIT